MILVGFFCSGLVALTTLIHYEALRVLTIRLPRLRVPSRMRLIVVIVAAFFAHLAEIVLYGFALFVLVRFLAAGTLSGAGGASLLNCMYFSAETFTSVGFGDLVPVGPVRLLAGAEALNGLLLIGWSASYAYIAMERFWNGERNE